MSDAGYTSVTPLCIFAPGRNSFDAIVRETGYPNAIKALIFDSLCLERYGWDFQSARLSKLKNTERGETVYRLMRPAAYLNTDHAAAYEQPALPAGAR